MTKLFEKPKVGDRIVLTDRFGDQSIRRIQKVTSKAIRVSGCNLYKFKRDGSMHKDSDREGRIQITIRPHIEE